MQNPSSCAGLGNEDSFCSCIPRRGLGDIAYRSKKRVSLAEHRTVTVSAECRKDESVIDETPSAYKPIEAVMAAQADLVEIVHTLKQVLCVKG